jgi:acetoacetate decarboxylase
VKVDEVQKRAFAMPLSRPSYPPGPYRYTNREMLIIAYRTDLDAVREAVPEPLEVSEPVVRFEFMKIPDSTGFGAYAESGQVIPVKYDGLAGSFVHSMFLDDEAPISGGREIWGFPKKFATPTLSVVKDTLLGTLDYGPVRIATGTMGYKHRPLDLAEVEESVAAPNFLLKIMPPVDGSTRICELVRYYYQNLHVKGAWTGPAALDLNPHALAPVADLPVHEVVSQRTSLPT